MSDISHKEEFDNDVCLEWLDNNQIVIFSAPRPSRDTVDTWEEKVIEVTDQYRYTVRYIHDFSQSRVVLTPYAREKAKLVNDTHPGQPNITNRIFFNREDALAWLRKFPVEPQ